MPHPSSAVLVPLLACAVLAGCSSGASTSTAPGSAPPASSAPSSSAAASSAPASVPSTSPTGGAPGSGAGGSITFRGAISGSMTVAVCHDGMAQLVVAVDGEDQRFNGLIDADDFTFVGPRSTGYTLADGASKPKVSGSTYTVRGTRLVGIMNDDTVTADGSVTCP